MSNDQNRDFIKLKAASITSNELSELCRILQLSSDFLEIKNPSTPSEAHTTLTLISEFINREHSFQQLSQVNQQKRAARRERKRRRQQDHSVSNDPLAMIDLNHPSTAFMVLEAFITTQIDYQLRSKNLTPEIAPIILAQTIRTVLRRKALWLRELDQDFNQSEQKGPQKAMSKLLSYYVISYEELSEYLCLNKALLTPARYAEYKSTLLNLEIRKNGKAFITDLIRKSIDNVIKSSFGKSLGVNLNPSNDDNDLENLGSTTNIDMSCHISHTSLTTEQEFEMGLFAEALEYFFGNQQAWIHQERQGLPFQGKELLPSWFSYYNSLTTPYNGTTSMGSLNNKAGKKILGFNRLLNLESVCTDTIKLQIANTLKMTHTTVQRNLVRLRVSLIAILCKHEAKNKNKNLRPVDALWSHAHYEYCEKNHHNHQLSGYEPLEQKDITFNLIPLAIRTIEYKYQIRNT